MLPFHRMLVEKEVFCILIVQLQHMVYHFVFDELADLLASMDPEKVLAFRTSEKAQSRLEKLLSKNKDGKRLSSAEQKEMEQFMLVEHIVGLAKARALGKLSQEG